VSLLSSNDSEALYANTGDGPQFTVLDIGLPDRVAVVEADRAFWAIVKNEALSGALSGSLVADFKKRQENFQKEMDYLRFGLKPSAAYFNPTERCNFNCGYCYLPEQMRRDGKTMTAKEVCDALERLLSYFKGHMSGASIRPQVIFHGSEPMMARDAVFAGIERFKDDFLFGVQTNASLLDHEAISFLTEHSVGIGISLDANTPEIADNIRKNWHGKGAFAHIVKVMDELASYPAFNVITTVTSLNVQTLPDMVDFYHDHGVKMVMFNPVRCTREGGQALKPDDDQLAKYFCAALDRVYNLFEKTGHKMVVTNFANILAAIIGPTARRLMCDISPCGGGRCFFAVSAHGDLFPCSEFIGFPEFKGGNLFKDELKEALQSPPFIEITQRKVEDISPCSVCAIRHFCGAPCPAEVRALSGTVNAPAPYCRFYEEQARYAFRVIANGREEAFLWEDWENETKESFCWA
jgi:uncharacterized protein